MFFVGPIIVSGEVYAIAPYYNFPLTRVPAQCIHSDIRARLTSTAVAPPQVLEFVHSGYRKELLLFL